MQFGRISASQNQSAYIWQSVLTDFTENPVVCDEHRDSIIRFRLRFHSIG